MSNEEYRTCPYYHQYLEMTHNCGKFDTTGPILNFRYQNVIRKQKDSEIEHRGLSFRQNCEPSGILIYGFLKDSGQNCINTKEKKKIGLTRVVTKGSD